MQTVEKFVVLQRASTDCPLTTMISCISYSYFTELEILRTSNDSPTQEIICVQYMLMRTHTHTYSPGSCANAFMNARSLSASWYQFKRRDACLILRWFLMIPPSQPSITPGLPTNPIIPQGSIGNHFYPLFLLLVPWESKAHS